MSDGEEQVSTRQRILQHLCSGDRTAAELSKLIGVTRSAIQMQVSALERDGLISHERLRRGVGKPAHRYHLAPAGEYLLSHAYLPVLERLLAVLGTRLGCTEFNALMRELGVALSPDPAASGAPRERVAAAVELLSALGANVAVELANGGAELRGECCPLSALTPSHPELCTAVEALLERFTDLSVSEECDREGRPSCRFSIAFPEPPGG